MHSIFEWTTPVDRIRTRALLTWSSVFVLQALGLGQILRLRHRAERLERERLTTSRVQSLHHTQAAALND